MISSHYMKERLISIGIVVLIIAVFLPFGAADMQAQNGIPADILRILYLFYFFLVGIVMCSVSEFVVSKIFRMPRKFGQQPIDFNSSKKASQDEDEVVDVRYIFRRNFAFQVVNCILTTLAVAYFNSIYLDIPGHDNSFTFRNILVVFSYMILASFILSLYWRNVYRNKALVKQLAESNRLNGILEERHRNMMQKKETETPAETTADPNVPTESAVMPNGRTAAASVWGTPMTSTFKAPPAPKPEPDGNLTLTGTTKDSLSITVDQLYYATSEANYTKIYYKSQGHMRNTLLRVSIKQLEEQLEGYDQIMRCHRAFIVNLDNLERVSAGSSGMNLVLLDCQEHIPVSRSYLKAIREWIANPK